MRSLVFLAALLSAPAYAHPPNFGQLSPEAQAWWNCMGEARNDSGQGIICCNLSDAHYLNDDEWRIGSGHYDIKVGDKWFAVPDKAVISSGACGPDPSDTAAAAKAWYAPKLADDKVVDAIIYCFLPGTEY